jgi:hypothetical protein
MKKLLFFLSLFVFSLIFYSAIANFSGPVIFLPETNHNFGPVRTYATTRWFLEIQNLGDETIVIDTAYFSVNAQYYFDQSIVFPLEISPSDSLLMGIWFQPNGEDEYFSFLEIINNDQSHDTVEVELSGAGITKIWEMGEEFWAFSGIPENDNSIRSILSTSDISDDGIDDMAVASAGDLIYCLNANSSGIADVLWQHQIPNAAVYGQNCLSLITDINDDGYRDIVVGTCGEDRSITVLSGKTGAEIWKLVTSNYGFGGCIYQVNVSYDYNGDGFDDVLAAVGDDGNGTGPNRVYCIDVFTGIQIWERPLGGPVYAVIGIEDFTGDAQPDVVAGVSNSTGTEGSAWAINGATGFTSWNTVMPGKSVRALVEVDDTENSGHKNVAIGDYSGEYRIIDPYTLYFVSVGGIGSFSIEYFTLLYDLNNDGNADILVASSAPKAIVLNGKSGPPLLSLPVADKSNSVARISDVSGDGINDILVGTSPENNFVYFVNAAHNDILFESDFKRPVTAIQAIPDINGDGSMEMSAGGQDGKLICLSGGIDALVGSQNIFRENQNQIVHGSFPNPFSKKSTIYFELKKSNYISMNVFDIAGQKVINLNSQFLEKGRHEIEWNISEEGNLENGFYFYNILSTEFVVTGKMILIK